MDQLEALACGEIGLKIHELYQLTPREFNNIAIGYWRKQEQQIQLQMVLNRELEFAIISPYLDKKHKNLTPQKYKPFIWEQPEAPILDKKLKTKEELQEIWTRVDAKTKQ